MSSSCRSIACLALTAVLPATADAAADAYFTPRLEVGTEYHTNRSLAPDGVVTPFGRNATGYSLDVTGIAGIRTQRAVTEVRPHLRFQDFPDWKSTQRVTGDFDINSNYRTQLDTWELLGGLSYQDRTDVQLVDGTYDDFDPDAPVVDGELRNQTIKRTQTDWNLRPSYTHTIGPRTGIGVEAEYQAARLETAAEETNAWGYDSWQAGGFITSTITQRTEIRGGAYYLHFQAEEANTTKGVGLYSELTRELTPTLAASLGASLERLDVEEGGVADNLINYGAHFQIIRRGQTSQLRLDLGRDVVPSTYGSLTTVDEVRLELRRDFSPRLHLTTSMRASRRNAKNTGIGNNGDRDYATGQLELRWNMTRTWWISGAYAYYWQDYKQNSGPGDDHRILARVVYSALPPRRR